MNHVTDERTDRPLGRQLHDWIEGTARGAARWHRAALAHPNRCPESTPRHAPAPALVAIQVVPFRVRRDA